MMNTPVSKTRNRFAVPPWTRESPQWQAARIGNCPRITRLA